ncbi:hypothetical protein Y032_0004g1699 [Ancylostoma ceylanicum]|uniref:Uncharacterized protein n=1 Tax=Ancylostoma ceylanicum TaxID=53326 RepID=A0A016VV84_9BILA|nr:hypothetical protein Y032_0004g1699 [Ancylostoma ceylanicum]
MEEELVQTVNDSQFFKYFRNKNEIAENQLTAVHRRIIARLAKLEQQPVVGNVVRGQFRRQVKLQGRILTAQTVKW